MARWYITICIYDENNHISESLIGDHLPEIIEKGYGLAHIPTGSVFIKDIQEVKD